MYDNHEVKIGDVFKHPNTQEKATVIYIMQNGRVVIERSGKDHNWAMDITPLDLQKQWVKQPREPDGWINVYDAGGMRGRQVNSYRSRRMADSVDSTYRIACVPYYKGQGLEEKKKKRDCPTSHFGKCHNCDCSRC